MVMVDRCHCACEAKILVLSQATGQKGDDSGSLGEEADGKTSGASSHGEISDKIGDQAKTCDENHLGACRGVERGTDGLIEHSQFLVTTEGKLGAGMDEGACGTVNQDC